ncbi:flavin monoamine oxidase family protein [Streptomyces sp. NPDC050145]|uniref:flavin monoamine oxidase family protein n=1 Tax=Streptomyces sp. NPDC050145 TaxID=3365602 RepID=UPI0037A40F7E
MSTIVIGAGLAGLAAERRLARHGEEVVVLEAQPYVGGRTRTVRDRLCHGQPADLGASFIDIGQDKILEYCADLKVAITPQVALFPTDPDGRLTAASPLRETVVVDGLRLADDARDRIADEVRAALDSAPPSPTETIPAWAARAGLSPVARRLFCGQTGYNPVHEASQIRMSMLEPPHVGRVCWMLADGTDSLARAMAEGVDIRLEQPVRLVRRGRGGLVVETDTDRFTGQDVVVATPVTPTLRIGFAPVLPEWKTDALLSTPMTQGGKVIGQYADGAELVRRLGRSALSDGPISLIWARPVGPRDSVVVLGLLADRADGVLRDEARALGALDRLVEAATGLRPRRLAGLVQDWTREPYAGGVVSTLMGDFPRLPSLLAQSVGPVHFAGEHTAEMWATGMDGALRSGERAADEVLQRRRGAKPLVAAAN